MPNAIPLRELPPGSREEALRLSEERFRLLVESVEDYAIFMLDPQGRVASWNPGVLRLKGYTADEIMGEHFSRFYPQEAIDRGWPEHELAVATERGRFEDEGWRIRKDGTRFWANVVISAVTDAEGQLVGFAKVTRDLTARREQENALRASEQRFRLLVEGVVDYAIFMLDPTGHVVSWNAGAERIKGYTAEEIVGQHITRFYPQDAVDRGWPEHELAVARRAGRFEDEGWRVRKDGTQFWASVVITPLYGAPGELLGFAKVTRDLTERRRVESLQQQGRHLNEFLAMLGHELRNPLAPIRNAAAILRAGETGADPRATWAREVIERQVTHLGTLVDDLLDLVRISTGRISVASDPVDLGAVVTKAVDTARTMFEPKQQGVEVHLPTSPLVVLGDAVRLLQIALNLLTNAHKYTQPHGNIRVEVERDGRFAQLSVRDDGAGIASDLLPHIFEPFVQGDRKLDRAEGGLGIGLALVHKLVELHGGTVSASSAGAQLGSEFVIRLPVYVEEPVELTVGEDDATRALGRRVLVVDDNQDAAESLAMLLDLWGHDVRTAEDGPAALLGAAEYAPDLVLLDIGLPGMDGYAVAEQLRHTPCVLVAMTGYGQQEDIDRAHEAGFDEHMVKPIDIARLEQLIHEVPKRPR